MWHLTLKYPEKIEILSTARLYVPSVVHELVIDPRNELEHCYRPPTETEARRAVQLCEMFLKATSDEAKHNAIISIGWSLSFSHERCVAPGREYDRIDFTISRDSSPMLLIDVTDMSQHDVIILLPRDGEVMACPLREFDRSAATKLATMLREQSGSLPDLLQRKYLRKLKEDIGL
jgi:hypothetical protein